MKYSTVAVAFASVALAAPSPARLRTRTTLTYDATNPPQIFTDATCSLSKSLTAGEPLSFNYPLASQLGTIITPVLDAALGKQTVEDLDTVADDLCM